MLAFPEKRCLEARFNIPYQMLDAVQWYGQAPQAVIRSTRFFRVLSRELPDRH